MRRGWAVLAILLAACGPASADPAFESVAVASSAEGCPAGAVCVEVTAPVVGTRAARGSCALYGPGDPQALEPLAEERDLPMRPGVPTVWTAQVPAPNGAAVNAVCAPMVEG